MNLDSLADLFISKTSVLEIGLVEATTILVPKSPVLLLSFSDEIIDVVIGPVSQHFQEIELFFSAGIWLDLESLGTVNDIFSHSDFKAVLNDVIMEAPCVKLRLSGKLFSDLNLQILAFFLIWIALHLLLKMRVVAFDVEEHLLVVRVDIELEQVLSHELIDLYFVPFDLVLDSDHFWIPVPIQSPPELLDFIDPNLMSLVSRDSGLQILTV